MRFTQHFASEWVDFLTDGPVLKLAVFSLNDGVDHQLLLVARLNQRQLLLAASLDCSHEHFRFSKNGPQLF